MLTGTLLVLWGTSKLTKSGTDGRAESFLAPTLAVDALDDDLRVIYMQSLVIDARCNARYGSDCAEVWSPFGREIRRGLVACQAKRHAGEADAAQYAEELSERASTHVQDGEPLDDEWRRLVAAARKLRGS